jgi:putative intracellular protease/amidase
MDSIVLPEIGAEKFDIGMIIFDNMTNLDFAGPNDVFAAAPAARIHVLAKMSGPVRTDSGMRILADMTLPDAPDLDMLFIGGGPGVTALMEDVETPQFLTQRAPHAKLITSVCTGALVLGAAGLLRGIAPPPTGPQWEYCLSWGLFRLTGVSSSIVTVSPVRA